MMTWSDLDERKNVRCSRRMLWQIVKLAQPAMVDGKCAECGMPWLNCSPQVVQHDLFCKGAERAGQIYDLIAEVTRRRPWWYRLWRRLFFWV